MIRGWHPTPIVGDDPPQTDERFVKREYTKRQLAKEQRQADAMRRRSTR